ncbi:NHX3 [Symbiodinium sp. CCMP2592]|nr:NHX3 [Symbiodinium sp. CCMP2592]
MPLEKIVLTRQVFQDAATDLPRAGQWANVFQDILSSNYQSKETICTALLPDGSGVEIVGKGFSRISSVLFIIYLGNHLFENYEGDQSTEKFQEDKKMFHEFLTSARTILVSIKDFTNSREKLYAAVAESQAIKERAPLTLVSLCVKIGVAMLSLAQGQGLDMATAGPPVRAKLLSAVIDEFNGHGQVGVNKSYQLNRHQQDCVRNLLLDTDPSALKEIQLCIDQVPEKRTPFKHQTLQSVRWLLGGGPKRSATVNDMWVRILAMDKEKQLLFFQILTFQAISALRAGDQKTMTLERWNENADYACFCGFLLQNSGPFVDKPEDLEHLRLRFIRGDFWDAARNFLLVKDPQFDIQQFPWPKMEQEANTQRQSSQHVDELSVQAEEARFKADLLSLTTDCAKALQHKQQQLETAKAKAAAEAAHVRNEILHGRKDVVEPFMREHCHIIAVDSINAAMHEWDEFLKGTSAFGAGNKLRIVIADLNKLGRVGEQELENLSAIWEKVITQDRDRSCVLVVLPVVVSKKRLQGRVPAKAESLRLCATLVHLRMGDEFHGNDGRTLLYDIVAVTSDSEDNQFLDSFLLRRRATIFAAEWLPTEQYYLPQSEPGRAAAVGSLSVERRAAQLLGGLSVAETLLRSVLFSGASTPKPLFDDDSIVIFHQTPYDGCLEEAALKLRKILKPRVAVFSATPVVDDIASCQGKIAKILLMDWKAATFTMVPESSRRFSSQLPTDTATRVQGSAPPELTSLVWEGTGCKIPEVFKWATHVVYASEWVKELDKAERSLLAANLEAAAGADPVAAPQQRTTDFVDVATLQSNAALVELASDFANVKFLHDPDSKSLYAFAKGGAGTIPCDKPVFSHAQGDWVRPPQSTRLLAKADTEELCLHVFALESDTSQVCVEVPGASGLEDTEAAEVHTVMQESTMAGMVDLKWWHHTVKLSSPR